MGRPDSDPDPTFPNGTRYATLKLNLEDAQTALIQEVISRPHPRDGFKKFAGGSGSLLGGPEGNVSTIVCTNYKLNALRKEKYRKLLILSYIMSDLQLDAKASKKFLLT